MGERDTKVGQLVNSTEKQREGESEHVLGQGKWDPGRKRKSHAETTGVTQSSLRLQNASVTWKPTRKEYVDILDFPP